MADESTPGGTFHGRAIRDRRAAAELLRRARLKFHREDEDVAFDLLQGLLAKDPRNLRAAYLTALCAHLLTNGDAIDDVCARALRVDRRHPYTKACEAVRYLYLANFSRAEDLFLQAIQQMPDELDLYLGLGVVYEYSDDIGKGIDIYQKAIDLDPDNVRARVALGGMYAMEGEYAKAMAQYQRAKAVEPLIENPHQKLGRDYYFGGMMGEAASEFGLAVAEEPEEPAAWFYLLDCIRRLGRCDDAIDLYQDIRARFGDDPELISGYYEHFQMKKEALAALERLVEQKPNDVRALVRLSNAYTDSDRVPEAIDAAERAAALAPSDAQVFTLLGQLYLKLGDNRLSVERCRRAIRLDRNAQAAYVTMADALLYLGRQEDSHAAIVEMERVREQAWRQYQAKFSGQDQLDAERQ
ncbi:MAG: tetratricopeptide repeat protein [candidate division WOR-3 bacterium]|nr:MAG: tetratricopeptide repeat protein [candidate division WOR-3 bacterium]